MGHLGAEDEERPAEVQKKILLTGSAWRKTERKRERESERVQGRAKQRRGRVEWEWSSDCRSGFKAGTVDL